MNKIQLPNNIHLGGNKIKLEIDESILEEGDLGVFYPAKNIIRLYPSAGTNIILHEFLEAISSTYRGGKVEHDLITLYAAGLADILNQLEIELIIKGDRNE